eukprot:6477633-Amphidinium_carterae.1
MPGVVGERMLGGGDKGAAGAILHRGAEQQLRCMKQRRDRHESHSKGLAGVAAEVGGMALK